MRARKAQENTIISHFFLMDMNIINLKGGGGGGGA